MSVVDPATLLSYEDIAARERIAEMVDGLLHMEQVRAKLEEEIRAVAILADEARHQIALELQAHRALLDVEDQMALDTGFVHYVGPRRAGNRRVDQRAIVEHLESLPPALHPRDVQKVVTRYPTLDDLRKHEGDLQVAGLTIDQLVDDPGWTEPTVEVLSRSAS